MVSVFRNWNNTVKRLIGESAGIYGIGIRSAVVQLTRGVEWRMI